MTSPELSRGGAMEARVARTLEDAGLSRADVERVVGAHRLAMRARAEQSVEDHHFDFLHPGRTVLVLLLDTPLRDPVALAAAALVETERDELRVALSAIEREVGAAVAAFLEAVPIAEEGLAEALVTATEDVRLVALAERLDHCRHAKFWADRGARRRIHGLAESVLGPVAQRTDATLARRYLHWTGAFARTLALED
jgi:(p)ppGpp synthase/HD superfamily hydrolase